MKAKNCLIFGGSGQIGRHLIRKLTKNNYRVTVVTRNIHQKGHIIKTQGNAGYIEIIEANIFDETKIRELFRKSDICINLVGILYENKRNTFENIHTLFPSILAKLCKQYNLNHFIHLSALGINEASEFPEETWIIHKGSRLTFRPMNSPSTAITLPKSKSSGKSFL